MLPVTDASRSTPQIFSDVILRKRSGSEVYKTTFLGDDYLVWMHSSTLNSMNCHVIFMSPINQQMEFSKGTIWS